MPAIDLKGALLSGARAWDAARFNGVDRTKFLNASEAAGCIRRVWYGKHHAADEGDKGFAWRGSGMESWITDMLILGNVPLLWHTAAEQVSIAVGDRLSATPDNAILSGDGPAVGLEIKTFDPRTKLSNLPRAGHVEQANIGMAALSKHLGAPVTQALLLYVNASDWSDIHLFPVDFDPALLEKSKTTARKVFARKDPSTLDRQGKLTGECRYCPFTAICGVDTEALGGGAQAKSRAGSKIADAVTSYADAQAAKKAAEASMSELGESIKAELKKRGVTSLTVSGLTAALTPVKGRATFDKVAAAAAAGQPVAAFEKTGKPSERLTVEQSQ